MFNLKMMPRILAGEEFSRSAPEGFGWITIFEVPGADELHVWPTNSAYGAVHRVTNEVEVSRVWISSLFLNPEQEALKLYQHLATKRGVKQNGHVVTNMPFDILVFWANENLGIPGFNDFGEIFQNNYTPAKT